MLSPKHLMLAFRHHESVYSSISKLPVEIKDHLKDNPTQAQYAAAITCTKNTTKHNSPSKHVVQQIIYKSMIQVAQLSLTNPHDALHHSKRQNFKTFT